MSIYIYSNHEITQGIAQLLFYQTEHGNLEVSEDYVSPEGFPLGEFVENIRDCYKEGLLDPKQIQRLENIGFEMDSSMQLWKTMLLRTQDYISNNGRLPTITERSDDNILIGAWVRKQILIYNRLSSKQQEELARIGIVG